MLDDETVTLSIASDPFHRGLAKFGKFIGFPRDTRCEKRSRRLPTERDSGMSPEEIAKSKAKLNQFAQLPKPGSSLPRFGSPGVKTSPGPSPPKTR